MDRNKVLDGLFDTKVLAILKLLFSNPDKQYYLKELSDVAKVSLASTFRITNRLVELNLVKLVKVSRFKLYQIGEGDEIAFIAELLKPDKQALDEFIEQVISKGGVDEVILLGKEQPNKANLLIIGSGIDNAFIKTLISSVREKFNYTITHLEFTRDQYTQLRSFGQFTEGGKTLYPKQ